MGDRNVPGLVTTKFERLKQFIKAPDLFTLLDVIGPYYFYCISFSVYLTVMCTAPIVYHTDLSFATIYRVVLTVVLLNLYVNYFMAVNQPSVYEPLRDGAIPDQAWQYCYSCQQYKPPRCHHCPLCNKCITKRDHHCFFLSLCIGQRNQRYFIVYCVYASIGLWMGFNVISQYLSQVYYEVNSWDFWHYVPPVTLISLLKGELDLLTFFVTILLSGCFMTGSFTFFLFLYQMYLVAFDMTGHESKGQKVNWSRLRLRDNVRNVFGNYWFVSFIIPITFSGAQASTAMDPSRYHL